MHINLLMVVIYSSAADKEAAERIANVLGDKTMLTDQFVLDSITDTTIVLVGGEVVNPNVKYLVDNLYIPGVYAVRDAVGYEPCMITYVKYNNKNVFVVAGWEAEYTKWASQVIEFYGGLPDINYLAHYDQQIIYKYPGRDYKQPLVIHFKLYNLPVIMEVYLKKSVDASTIQEIASQLTNSLESKNFYVYSTSFASQGNGYNEIIISCESDYQTAAQYYSQINNSLAIPVIVLVAVVIFAVTALIFSIGYLVDRINYWKFTINKVQVEMDTVNSVLSYCQQQGIPLDQCINALQTVMNGLQQASTTSTSGTSTLSTILTFSLIAAVIALPIKAVSDIFKKKKS